MTHRSKFMIHRALFTPGILNPRLRFRTPQALFTPLKKISIGIKMKGAIYLNIQDALASGAIKDRKSVV